MFGDLFGVTREQALGSAKALAINNVAIALVLIEKGIITDDELDKAHTKATHMVDQGFAAQQEKAQKEFDEEHPGTRKFFEKISGLQP